MTAVPAPGIGTHVTTHYEQFRPYPHLPLQVLSVAVRRRLNRRIPSRDRRVLAAALHLLDHGTDALFGYELFACMLAGAAGGAMNHGRVYRSLRALEERGLVACEPAGADGRARFRYRLSPAGITAAHGAGQPQPGRVRAGGSGRASPVPPAGP